MRKAKAKLDERSLAFATIPELGRLLQAREVKPSELVKFFGERLERIGPVYNALACSTRKQAQGDISSIDYAFHMGRERGALAGIPYGVKDLIAVAGYPTTWGAKPFQEQRFDHDARVVQKLDDADALLIGKLAMVELAGGGGYNMAAASLQGPGLNPWNTQYWSGGSSSGSAIAVAAGLLPFTIGSETSGSILTPASYCGVTGLRPTYGLVSRAGAMTLSWTLDKLGVFAHTAEDCALVLHVIAGGDSEDTGSAGKSFYYTPNWYQKIGDLRVGYAETDWTDWPDEVLRPAFREALATVKSLGAQMQETRIPDYPYGPVIGTIIDAEAVSVFETFIRSGQVNQLADPTQIAGLKAALNYSAIDYLKAMRVRSMLQQDFRKVFADLDLLVAPTRFNVPERVDRPFDAERVKRPDVKGLGSGLIQASNLCGLPAISLPCGFVNGLPIGLQIVAPPFLENRMVAFAKAFQDRTPFHKQHPPDASVPT